MSNFFCPRVVLRTIILGGVSLSTVGIASGDDTTLLDPPIIPPTVLDANDLPSPIPMDSDQFNSIDLNEIASLSDEANDLALSDETDGETIRERYSDGSVKVERFVTLDDKSNYVNHGEYRYFSQTGDLIAEGKYLMGHRDGTWRRIYATGDAKIFGAYPYNEFQAPFISKAEFAVGNLNGSWTITDAHGKTVSEIPLRDGLRHGRAIWNHPNGKLMYEATYVDGMLEGKMAEFDENGTEIASHDFQAGRRIEREVEHYKNQQVKAEYEYLSVQQELKERDDWWEAKPAVYETVGKRVKHGKFAEWHPNGQKKASGVYQQDRLSGPFSSWFENGQRETKGEYQLGTPEGDWTWWHANGMRRAQGAYANGTPDGAWTSWTVEGKLAKQQTYSDAKGSSVVRSRGGQQNNSAMRPRRSLR